MASWQSSLIGRGRPVQTRIRRCRATSAAGRWRPRPTGAGCPSSPVSVPPHRRPAFLWFVLALIALNWISVLVFRANNSEPRVTVPFSPYFLDQVKGDQVHAISSKGDTIEGTFKVKLRYPPSSKDAKPTKLFATQIPTFWNGSQLSALLQEKDVEINAKSTNPSQSLLSELLLGFGPTLLIVGLFVLLARRAAKARGGWARWATSAARQARRVDPETIRVTFDDVAGIDEAKAELSEIVDFLRNPERYSRLGGRMPHGVLLSGRPGTGKTLLARAVAGEAHAAFFSISASEFIEAIVGVGASRVRDLFAKAKEAAPSIIFIDEIDAIGRSRQGSAAISGANDEREQTLDQILTELDGFESSEAVVVLAATNRPDILDPALLRAGRFDRRVAVQPPDRKGRAEILEVHTRSIPLADDVDLEALAASTPGMVGADLANLANEAALLAARRDHEKVEMADFTDSLEKIILGAPRGILLSPADRERTAYHESGHALVGMLTPGADPVRKVSIIPRGMALGVTLADARQRSRLLQPRGARREDPRRARRARRRGGRLRDDHHRRRVRHPAAHPDRPADGRAVGDERGDRAARGAAGRRPGAAAAGRQRDLRAHAGADRLPRRSGSSRTRTARSRGCWPSTATSSRASRRRCSRRRRSTRRRPTRPRACRSSRPSRRPPRSRARLGAAEQHVHADRADGEAGERRGDDRRRGDRREHVLGESRARRPRPARRAERWPRARPRPAFGRPPPRPSRIATFSAVRAAASASIVPLPNSPPRSR